MPDWAWALIIVVPCLACLIFGAWIEGKSKTMASEKHYGINVRFSNGHWGKYWYGSNKFLRDEKYKKYKKMDNVLAVKKVQIKI